MNKIPTVEEPPFDFVVVGGGIAGMCAAVSAARLGLKTALVHDRDVLGGNNSSEVRVHACGSLGLDPYPNLGLSMREFVGMAAYVCNSHSCLPRSVYSEYLGELKNLMEKGIGNPDLPDNQNYYLGRRKVTKHRFVSPDVE